MLDWGPQQQLAVVEGCTGDVLVFAPRSAGRYRRFALHKPADVASDGDAAAAQPPPPLPAPTTVESLAFSPARLQSSAGGVWMACGWSDSTLAVFLQPPFAESKTSEEQIGCTLPSWKRSLDSRPTALW